MLLNKETKPNQTILNSLKTFAQFLKFFQD